MGAKHHFNMLTSSRGHCTVLCTSAIARATRPCWGRDDADWLTRTGRQLHTDPHLKAHRGLYIGFGELISWPGGGKTGRRYALGLLTVPAHPLALHPGVTGRHAGAHHVRDRQQTAQDGGDGRPGCTPPPTSESVVSASHWVRRQVEARNLKH